MLLYENYKRKEYNIIVVVFVINIYEIKAVKWPNGWSGLGRPGPMKVIYNPTSKSRVSFDQKKYIYILF